VSTDHSGGVDDSLFAHHDHAMDGRGICIPGSELIGCERPDVAMFQAGVFTRAQARTAGWADSRQRRLLRDGLWVGVAGSAVRHREVAEGPWQRAWAVALTGRVPSHSTAAAIWGYAVADESCHGIVDHGGGPSRRLIDHRLPLPGSEVLRIAGLPITNERRTLIDLLCGQRVEASLGTVTDGLRRGLLEPFDLAALAQEAKGRIGARRARWIAESCAGNPWSVLEWRFQKMARTISSGWRFNVDVSDGRGVIGPVDAVHEGARIVVELDGKRFHGPERFQHDRTRDQRLVAMGYVVLRFTWADLEERPDEVMAIIRRTMAQRMRRAS
jgi:very-short-patch-repair endonuclease